MAVRTQVFSLLLSDICYTPSCIFLFSFLPVAESLDRDRLQRVAYLLQE